MNMLKDKRSRRQIRAGLRYDEYDTIGTVNNGTIKIIKAKQHTTNASVPLFSNRMNTVYMITKETNEKDRITSIAVYRNGKISQNINLNESQGIHYHNWVDSQKNGKAKRRKLPDHHTRLSPKHKRFVQFAKEWNDQ